jgi:hypothetical protein
VSIKLGDIVYISTDKFGMDTLNVYCKIVIEEDIKTGSSGLWGEILGDQPIDRFGEKLCWDKELFEEKHSFDNGLKWYTDNFRSKLEEGKGYLFIDSYCYEVLPKIKATKLARKMYNEEDILFEEDGHIWVKK